jgi:hypothetical protein
LEEGAVTMSAALQAGARNERTLSDLLEQEVWIGRCAGRMCVLGGSVDPEETTQMARAMWTLQRFRRQTPEAVAAFLLSNSAIRP